MNKNRILIILALLFSLSSTAQKLTLKMGENDLFSSQNSNDSFGTIYIIQDAALNNLVNKHVELSATLSHTPGYRLQVFFSSARSARQEAEQIQKKFKTGSYTLPVYLEYKAPFWKVKLGDFKIKNEALRVKRKLLKEYPNSWIIKDMVKIEGRSSDNSEENNSDNENVE